MKLSTLDYLNVVSPYLPPQLVSPSHLNWIESIAAILPLSSNLVFECRLGSQAPEADFLVAIIPSDGSRGAWAGENSLSEIPELCQSDAIWRVIQSLLADWHHDPALAPIHDTWLEFDLRGTPSGLPAPSFFFGFEDAVAHNYPALAVELVERLTSRPLSKLRRQGLLDCYAALPEDSLIFQVGVFLARQTDEIRLCTRRIPAAEALAYLENIDWPGSIAQLRQLLAELEPLVDGKINLDISVDETVLPEVGLECTIFGAAPGRAKARALFDYLAEKNACIPEKGAAILDWLGYSTEHSDRNRWPEHLLRASQTMDSDVTSAFVRTLNHIKINFQTDKPLTAKVYLGARHLWSRRAAESSL